jgi:hypothetical protein
MPRQRLGLPHGLSTTLGQKLIALAGLALIYGGGVILALAAGASPHDVETYTGYSSVYHHLAGLHPAGWSTPARIAIVVVGLLLFGILMWLGWAQRVIPQRARTPVVITDDALGRIVVSPRAIERAAEFATAGTPGVHAVKARLGDGELTVSLHARSADAIPQALQSARDRAQTALQTSGLPSTTVRVIVTRFTAPSTREQLR